jgi:fluoroquinolone transport system permease protein
MKAHVVSTLIYADTRLVWRDPLLAWVLLLPLGLAALFRVLIPRVGEALSAAVGVDLTPFYPLIMGGYLMTAPGIVGMVIGFLLLDERDARTLSALRVTPLSMRHYLAYRVTLPLLAGTATTLIGYPLIGLTALPMMTLVPIAAVAALSAPSLALVLVIAAPNKVAGFAVVKLLNMINLLPMVAFFVPPPLQYVAGVLPAFWPMRALWSAAAGEPFVTYLVVGSIVGAAAIAIAGALFDRRLLQRG